MNYLAHLFLAQPTPESMIGNLLPDFTKNMDQYPLSRTVLQGVANHRLVDRFTDSHPLVIASKRSINSKHRRFAGIIVDVSFDYFLSKYWKNYTLLDLDQFIQQSYANLQQDMSYIPANMQFAINNMVIDDTLSSYQHKAGIDTAFKRISRRIKRENSLSSAIEAFEQNYSSLDRTFQQFFPELIDVTQRLHYASSSIKLL